MQEDRRVPWSGKSGDNEGVIAIYTSEDEPLHPAEGEVKTVVDACRSLLADAVILESIDHAIVVSVSNYDDTYATAICDPEANLPAIARGLRVRLYDQFRNESPGVFLPAATVRKALDRWEGQIAMVFGRQLAAKLVSGRALAITQDRMTRDGLEQIRIQILSATGRCIDLQKADK